MSAAFPSSCRSWCACPILCRACPRNGTRPGRCDVPLEPFPGPAERFRPLPRRRGNAVRGWLVLRRKARRVQEDDDPLDAAQERRVRAVLALGGVPQADLPDGVQQVRLRLLERAAKGDEAPRDVSAWAAVVASNLAMDWHRAKRRQERVGSGWPRCVSWSIPPARTPACCPWRWRRAWTNCRTAPAGPRPAFLRRFAGARDRRGTRHPGRHGQEPAALRGPRPARPPARGRGGVTWPRSGMNTTAWTP